jgi:hypothetical protein
VDNSGENYEIIAEGTSNEISINNKELWNKLTSAYNGN